MRTPTKTILATLLATTVMASPAFAQEAADEGASDDIIVTAQKREQNLQDVPISIQALGTKKLDQLGVSDFNDFSKLLPSISFQTTQPGSTTIYMRGVASGGDGNHSASLPSVGVYLDEQPVTTIGGTLDVHIYDIARIESLAGPQGTLYGASSQAGTVRIITNKPDATEFAGRVDGEVNSVRKGGIGGKVEGMVNVPISENAAVRVVGWYERGAGYIDNVSATRSFLPIPGGIVVNNTAFVENNINEQEIIGGRAALKIDLDDNWTVTPTVMFQQLTNKGSFGFDPLIGDLKINRFADEFRKDRFIQAALTIEGKIGNWDMTYASAYLDRKVKAGNDYTDYAEAYDSLYASSGGLASYFYLENAAGIDIDPRQFVVGGDHFRKMSQEFRVASPQSDRFRVVAGLFYQRQSNEIFQDYQVKNLAPLLSVNGRPGTLWLTNQKRVDKDYAAFGELSYDIAPNLTLTAGGRAFIFDNSLIGFFGFGRNPAFIQGAAGNPPPNGAGSSRTGVAGCLTVEGITLREAQLQGRTTQLLPGVVPGTFCTNLGVASNGGVAPKSTEGSGFTHRVNLTWKPSDDVLLYGTWSRGFRPGGINRRATIAPYETDYLTNYELGFKTTLLNGKMRFNAAAYMQDWKTFQYAFLGENSFTQIQNGPDARIKGIEADLNVTPVDGLSLTIAGAYTDAKTRNNLCAIDDPSFTCTLAGSGGQINYVTTEKGSRLPITPKFKINATARYEFDAAGGKAHLQTNVSHQSSAASDIRNKQLRPLLDNTDPLVLANPLNFYNPAASIGRLKAFTTVDLAVGIDWSKVSAELFVANLFDERGQLSRYQQCGNCSQRTYIVPTSPRMIGVRLGTKF